MVSSYLPLRSASSAARTHAVRVTLARAGAGARTGAHTAAASAADDEASEGEADGEEDTKGCQAAVGAEAADAAAVGAGAAADRGTSWGSRADAGGKTARLPPARLLDKRADSEGATGIAARKPP
mmetsp:Transcript_117935/g.376007  ORF Transcript_117935/g.376007 Transcript_117935/m.376007 type:complete len:125 (+) Transcript_117935:1401-1775(+)